MHYTSTYLSVRITEWVCYKRETRTRDNISPAAKTHYFAILERERERERESGSITPFLDLDAWQ